MSENQVLSTYAAYSQKEKERLNSSSGGIFSLLANDVLADGGAVYGVAMSDDCRRAEFLGITDEVGLERLRTSKYLQAHVGMTFKQVKQDLDSGMTVLFTGTGCQVNGLIEFLGAGKGVSAVREKYPNLYCMDVICHGAPSPALWREYVEYVETQNNAKLVSVNFRCKDNSWTDFGMKEQHKRCENDEDVYKEMFINKNQDPYMLMFLRDYCLRPSCYECKAKEIKLADITVSDFWGIQKIDPAMSDGKGTSLVLIRTESGERLFQRIVDKLKIKEVSYEDGVAGNKAEYRSAARPVWRDTFFTDMNKMTFEELKGKYGMPIPVPMKRKIKAGIKKVLIKAKIILLGGGVVCDNSSYGLLFVFSAEHGKNEGLTEISEGQKSYE